MKLWLLGFIALFLAGCAEDTFYKPDGNGANYYRDLAACRMYAESGARTPPQLAPVYTATTNYNGTYNPTFGTVNGTATTNVQAQPNPNQGYADLGNAIGNAIRGKRMLRNCMEANGYLVRPSS